MSDHSNLSDEQLAIGGISADGSEKVAELISRYTGLVFALAAKFSDMADYEELVSDGFDALLNAVSHYDEGRGSFSGFASVCITNRMRNTADKAIRRKSRIADESELERLEDTAPSPEELFFRKESSNELTRRMRASLTPLECRCMEGIILGHSYAEIAEKVGVDRKSVDNAVARARAKLKAEFSDF